MPWYVVFTHADSPGLIPTFAWHFCPLNNKTIYPHCCSRPRCKWGPSRMRKIIYVEYVYMYKFACNPMIGSSASGVEIVHCIKVRLEIVSNDQGNNSMFMLCLEHRTGWKCAHYKYSSIIIITSHSFSKDHLDGFYGTALHELSQWH